MITLNTFASDKKYNLGIYGEIDKNIIERYNTALNKDLEEMDELRSKFKLLDNEIKVSYTIFKPREIDIIKI